MNTPYTKYKIWRFAYNSYIDHISVPEGTVFYCFDKNRKNENSYKGPDNSPVWNEHWIAVIPYSKEIEKFNETRKQTVSLNEYIINKKYIIWNLEQIYPLDNNWPETNVIPDISNEYIKYRSNSIKYSNEYWNSEMNRINSLKLSDIDKEEEIKNTFMPVTRYIKINGLTNAGQINISTIDVKSCIDGESLIDISKYNIDINKLLYRGHFESIDISSKNEFDKALNIAINEINTNEHN